MRLVAIIVLLLSVTLIQAQVADLPFSNGAVIRYDGDSTYLVTYNVPYGGGTNGGIGLVHINCEGYCDKNVGSYAISKDSALNFRRIPNPTVCDTTLGDIIYSADHTNYKDFHIIRTSGPTAGNSKWVFTYAKLRGQGDSIEYIRSDCHGITDTISSTNREHITLSGSTLIKQDTSQWLYVAIGDNFLTFKVNSSGIVKYGRTQSVGTNQNFIGSNFTTQKASHDASQVVLVRERGNDMLTLFDFDKNTGKLNNPKTMLRKSDLPNYDFCTGNRKSNLTGLAFSENDSLIYLVYRYFPNCANINQLYQVIYQLKRFYPYPYLTKKVVHSTLLSKPSAFRRDIFMELGPDGNIYFGEHFDSTIHRISNSNEYGGATVSYNVFKLKGGDFLGYQASYIPSAYQRASFDIFTSCVDDTVRAVFYGSDDIQNITYY
ncbi:MAG: hypothetical protein RLZZ337_1069 [Bacteroidota bacterium]